MGDLLGTLRPQASSRNDRAPGEVALTYINGRRSFDDDRRCSASATVHLPALLFSLWKRLDSGYAPSASLHPPELEEIDVTNIQI
jgi:hypothetical protein